MTNAPLETRARHSKVFIYSLMVTLVLAALLGGFGYWYFWVWRDFTSVYAQLGILPLPLNVELEGDISKRLQQLSRESCFKDGVIGFADALISAGYPREADASLSNFAKRCGGSPDAILLHRHKALLKASDYAAALAIANELVSLDPSGQPIVTQGPKLTSN